jgi:hypothetical protein
MDDLRVADVDFLTIGQYLQPSVKHAAIDRFVTPEEFSEYATLARAKGFLLVSATPLTRSSYHADADFAALRDARAAGCGAAREEGCEAAREATRETGRKARDADHAAPATREVAVAAR